MVRHCVAALAALILLPSLPATSRSQSSSPSQAVPVAPAGEPTPAFPARVEVVTVDVVVVDRSGKAITGLGRADFRILEDGVPQTVTSFEAMELPSVPAAPVEEPSRRRVSTNTGPEARPYRTFMIVFDDVQLTPAQGLAAKAAIGQFLRTGVRDGDRVTLIATGGGAWWNTLMPAGRDELVTILKRLEGRYLQETSPDRVTEYEAMRIVAYDDPDVAYQVQRRFDAYQVTGRNQSGERLYRDTLDRTSTVGLIDPYVRAQAVDVYRQMSQRRRIYMRSMSRALAALANVRGRKAMLYVSRGFVAEQDQRDVKALVDASVRYNVPIHFIDARGLKALPDFMTAEFASGFDVQDTVSVIADITRDAEGSENLALDTGGLVVKNTNDLSAGITRVAIESQTYYLIGYSPQNTARDGKFRKIEVRLAASSRGRSLRVRARRGYYAPDDDRKVDSGRGQDPEIGRALDSPFERKELPLRVSAFAFDETTAGRLRVLLATGVDVREVSLHDAEGRRTGEIAFLVEMQHRETGEFWNVDEKIEMAMLPATFDRLQQNGYTVTREFSLPPGGYQAKIVVRDLASGRIGSVIHDFDVPATEAFRVSTPVLSDALEERATGSSGPPRPLLSVRRRFAPGTVLYAQYSVFGASVDPDTRMPRVRAGYDVVAVGGGVFKTGAATPITPTSIGGLLRMNGIDLAGAPPGRYELVLRVKDEISGAQLEAREPFEIGT